MTWMTLESPSFNGVNAGTQIKLSVESWAQACIDRDPETIAQGDTDKPIKMADGLYVRRYTLVGQFSDAFAKDTAIWNPTIIGGTSVSALPNGYFLRDLLESAFTEWWREAASGNWHNDGTPPRSLGTSRLQFGKRATNLGAAGLAGGLVANYIYGKVVGITFDVKNASAEAPLLIGFMLQFDEADVDSIG